MIVKRAEHMSVNSKLEAVKFKPEEKIEKQTIHPSTAPK